MTDINNLRIRLYAKKLGVLIYNSRIVSAGLLMNVLIPGINGKQFKSYEKGISSPSLPELEALAYFLDFPIDHFWGNKIQPTDKMASFQSSEDLART